MPQAAPVDLSLALRADRLLRARRWARRVWRFTVGGREASAEELVAYLQPRGARPLAQLAEVFQRLEGAQARGTLAVEAMLTRYIPAAPTASQLRLFDSERFHARAPLLAEARRLARSLEREPSAEPEPAELPERVLALLRSRPERAWLLGAGLSRAAGVATYRGPDSAFGQASPGGLKLRPGERVPSFLSLPYYLDNPDVVWAHVLEVGRVLAERQPTLGHRVLAALERGRPGPWAVTQNVDGFEARAGLEALYLHGRGDALQCLKEGGPAEAPDPRYNDEGFPICPRCGSLLKPGVVMFFEGIDGRRFDQALDLVGRCKLLIEVGTSHTVYPARELWKYALSKGAEVLVLNLERPPDLDQRAHFVGGDCQAALLAAWRALRPGEPLP